jgi:hypothetical protein
MRMPTGGRTRWRRSRSNNSTLLAWPEKGVLRKLVWARNQRQGNARFGRFRSLRQLRLEPRRTDVHEPGRRSSQRSRRAVECREKLSDNEEGVTGTDVLTAFYRIDRDQPAHRVEYRVTRSDMSRVAVRTASRVVRARPVTTCSGSLQPTGGGPPGGGGGHGSSPPGSRH